MDKPVAKPGEVVALPPLDEGIETDRSALLVKSRDVRITHVVIPAGQEIPTHESEGEVVLHCLRGRLKLTALGETHELKCGELLYLSINEPFSAAAMENSALLVIVLTPKQGQNVELIGE